MEKHSYTKTRPKNHSGYITWQARTLGVIHSLAPAPTVRQVDHKVRCTAYWGEDHLRKDCHEDVFGTRCRTRSHTTEMCHVPAKTVKSNIICIYFGSIEHISGRCYNKLNDNREEPRSMPRDLREWKPNNTYNRMSQPQVSCHQARFDEGLNKWYLPNYVNYYQYSLGSIPGQDLNTTLMELANSQSRSLEMMAASQRSQQKYFRSWQEPAETKWMTQCSLSSKSLMAQTDKHLRIGLMKSTKPADQAIEISGLRSSRSPQELCIRCSWPVTISQTMNWSQKWGVVFLMHQQWMKLERNCEPWSNWRMSLYRYICDIRVAFLKFFV